MSTLTTRSPERVPTDELEYGSLRYLQTKTEPRFPWSQLRAGQTIGEIKPHTQSGIRAGKLQLAQRDPQGKLAKVLFTYRRSDPGDLVEVLGALGPRYDTWYRIGARHFDFTKLVPLERCPACLGNHIEGTVRDVVRRTSKMRLDQKRGASVKGPDVALREFAEFLTELTNEAGTDRSSAYDHEDEVDRDSSSYVRWIQQALNDLIGAGLVVDGVAGPRTGAAVQAFQRRRGLVPDGAVGPLTERALVRAGVPEPPNSSASDVPPSDGASSRRCFSPTEIAAVRALYQQNHAAATEGGERSACIVMLNVALGQLLRLPLRSWPARTGSARRVPMGHLTTHSIESAMEQLRRAGHTSSPHEIDFHDRRGRRAGTLRPERLAESVSRYVLSQARPAGCWYAFGLSIMDGYHSVLLLVNSTGTAPRIYWLDQNSPDLRDDITSDLDLRITQKTTGWWDHVMSQRNIGYKTTTRVWSLQR